MLKSIAIYFGPKETSEKKKKQVVNQGRGGCGGRD